MLLQKISKANEYIDLLDLNMPRKLNSAHFICVILPASYVICLIGPLHDLVTWYKITYTGEQVGQWDFQNKGRCIVVEVPPRNLLTSICNFVLCDRAVQRAYSPVNLCLSQMLCRSVFSIQRMSMYCMITINSTWYCNCIVTVIIPLSTV